MKIYKHEMDGWSLYFVYLLLLQILKPISNAGLYDTQALLVGLQINDHDIVKWLRYKEQAQGRVEYCEEI